MLPSARGAVFSSHPGLPSRRPLPGTGVKPLHPGWTFRPLSPRSVPAQPAREAAERGTAGPRRWAPGAAPAPAGLAVGPSPSPAWPRVRVFGSICARTLPASLGPRRPPPRKSGWAAALRGGSPRTDRGGRDPPCEGCAVPGEGSAQSGGGRASGMGAPSPPERSWREAPTRTTPAAPGCACPSRLPPRWSRWSVSAAPSPPAPLPHSPLRDRSSGWAR